MNSSIGVLCLDTSSIIHKFGGSEDRLLQNYDISHTDLFGQALLDFVKGDYTEDITTYISLGEEDIISMPYLFRTEEQMPPLERQAMELSRGSVLDIGCGAGSHSLYLQKEGFDVTGLDISQGAIETCMARGINQLVKSDIWQYSGMKFDTILLLMNGIGLAGRLNQLADFLNRIRSLMKPEAQILLDSSDIIYMFEKDQDGAYWVPGHVDYYGEVDFILEYKGVKSPPFPWLYLDYNTLSKTARENKFTCELVSRGKHFDYLARLRLKS